MSKIVQRYGFTILEDQRLPVIKKLLESTIKLVELQGSIIYVSSDNTVYIISNEGSVLYCFNISECIPDCDFMIDAYNTFQYKIVENNDPNIKTKTAKISLYNLSDYECILNTDFIAKKNCIDKINQYIYHADIYPIIAKEENILKGPYGKTMMEYLSLKADQGAKFFKYYDQNISYMFPICTGFPSLTKADDMDIIVRQMENHYEMIELIVHKKKIGRDFRIIFRTLNVFQ